MTRILGVGSPFGADRLAWEAIDHLAGMGMDNCELLKLDRPGSGLLAYFTGVDSLILLDAVVLDTTPGGVSLLDGVQLRRLDSCTSSHGFGVVQAIDLAEKLGQLPERLQIVGIHTGADLSTPPVLDTEALEALIGDLL
ncbi:MAG: hydrogenase maturation protease [Chromatiales bacterium]|jgi:hydrogenase maturation protease